eukprot:7573135-Prorocentrum_lima.AAC.1
MHFGLRLPGVLSSFGPVASASVSNWATVKPGHALIASSAEERVTYLSKVELFNQRSELRRPAS